MLIDNASLVTSCFLRDTERLASKWTTPQLPISDRRHRPLPVVLKELVISLRGKSGDNSDLNFDALDFGESIFPVAGESSTMEESMIDSETSRIQDQPTDDRQPGQDPLWAIADVMLDKVERLFACAIKEHSFAATSPATEREDVRGMLHTTRVTEDKVRPRSFRAMKMLSY